MLGISFSELFVILVVGAVLVRPKDIPHIVKAIKKARQYLFKLKKEFLAYYNDFHEEIDEVASETKYIIDQEGKPQVAYDISDLEELRPKKKKELTEIS